MGSLDRILEWPIFPPAGSWMLRVLALLLGLQQDGCLSPRHHIDSNSDWKKYRPSLPFSFLARDFPRSFFISQWQKFGHMLWQWLPITAPSPHPAFTASHTANCGHVTKCPLMRASCWLKYKYTVQSSSGRVGPDSQVSSCEPHPCAVAVPQVA